MSNCMRLSRGACPGNAYSFIQWQSMSCSSSSQAPWLNTPVEAILSSMITIKYMLSDGSFKLLRLAF